MKIRFMSFLFVVAFVFLGCNNNESSNNSNSSKEKTVSGVVVDGYISGATVCIDINENDTCDDGEISSTTSGTGTYSFDTSYQGEAPIIIVGGIDTATNKSFEGVLKNIVNFSDDNISNITITPLTTLSSEMYTQKKKSDVTYTLDKAKESLANSLGIIKSQISLDPMSDTEVFSKAQQVVQTVELLSLKLDNSKKENFSDLMVSMAKSINELNSSSDFNITNVVDYINTNGVNGKSVTIDQNTKTFINDFSTKIDEQAKKSLGSELSSLQDKFSTYKQSASEKISQGDTSTLSNIINNIVDKNQSVCETSLVNFGENPVTKECKIFATKCDIPTGWETCDPFPDVEVCLSVISYALNPTTNKCLSFPNSCTPDGWETCKPIFISGVAVDGYISKANVCIDINENNTCDTNEPNSITASTGTFSLDNTNLSGEYPIIATGGKDTADNTNFEGLLKNIVELNDYNESIYITLSPLTTLLSEYYKLNKENNSSYTLGIAKQDLAKNIGLSQAQILKDPMSDNISFSKAQQITQTIELLSLELNGTKKENFSDLMVSMAKSINESNEFNISLIVDYINTNGVNGKNVTIDQNTKIFISEFANKMDQQAQKSYSSELVALQSKFYTYEQNASQYILDGNTSALSDIINNIEDINQSSCEHYNRSYGLNRVTGECTIYKNECFVPVGWSTSCTPSRLSDGMACMQVIAYALDPVTNECKGFPDPCSTPRGWKSCNLPN